MTLCKVAWTLAMILGCKWCFPRHYMCICYYYAMIKWLEYICRHNYYNNYYNNNCYMHIIVHIPAHMHTHVHFIVIITCDVVIAIIVLILVSIYQYFAT
jgi:hypothetical protein